MEKEVKQITKAEENPLLKLNRQIELLNRLDGALITNTINNSKASNAIINELFITLENLSNYYEVKYSTEN